MGSLFGSSKSKSVSKSGLPEDLKKPRDTGIGVAGGQIFDPVGAGVGGRDIGNILERLGLSGTEDVFQDALAQQRGVIGGSGLNITETPAFQNLADALAARGSRQFQDLSGNIRQGAAGAGAFNSSARVGLENQAASDVAQNLQETLANVGAQLFSQERQAQEQAAARGLGLPGGFVSLADALRQGGVGNLIELLNVSREGQTTGTSRGPGILNSAVAGFAGGLGKAIPIPGLG